MEDLWETKQHKNPTYENMEGDRKKKIGGFGVALF